MNIKQEISDALTCSTLREKTGCLRSLIGEVVEEGELAPVTRLLGVLKEQSSFAANFSDNADAQAALKAAVIICQSSYDSMRQFKGLPACKIACSGIGWCWCCNVNS